jgi:prophage regulatory protein
MVDTDARTKPDLQVAQQSRRPPTSRASNTADDLKYRRTIRRTELRRIVPLADTTIYELERRGEFPRRFNLTPRCVVWDLAEVEAWLDARRAESDTGQVMPAPPPDVRRRKHRPVKAAPAS